MLAPASPHAYAQQRSSLRSRIAGVVLALAMVALLLLVMLRMGAFGGEGPGKGARLVAIALTPDAAQRAQAKAQSHQKQAAATPQLRRVTAPPVVIPVRPKPAFIQLSRAEFAASDIGKLGQKGDSGNGSGPSAAAYGPGEGPGGARLYKAEWVREPSDAELVTYIPRGAPRGATADIACQTIEHFHVENCRSLGEAPPGSGLARGLRLAAWQFLVRPPRIDGKPQIGTWVRIHFDFGRIAKQAPDDPQGDDASGG